MPETTYTTDPTVTLKRGFFTRLFGKCGTEFPEHPGCWSFEGGVLNIDLNDARELSTPGGGIRFESDVLPSRVLVIHGDDGLFHAFENVCSHGKRRLDPVPGAGTVQCCSVGKSTFGYSGEKLAGAAQGDIAVYDIIHTGSELKIHIG